MIEKWVNSYRSTYAIAIDFENRLGLGAGYKEHRAQTDRHEETYEIALGTSPISFSNTLLARNNPLTDKYFGHLAITGMHELTHCVQNMSKDTPEMMLISEISTFGNMHYRRDNWGNFPHEIQAEYTGTMKARLKMRQQFPEQTGHVDTVILECVNERARDSRHPIHDYMPEEGFKSQNEVVDAFHTAMKELPDRKRNFVSTFRRHEDGMQDIIVQILADEDGNRRPEYRYLNEELQNEESGLEFDRKLACVMLYVYPKLYELYPQLQDAGMEPQTVFKDNPRVTKELFARTPEEMQELVGYNPDSISQSLIEIDMSENDLAKGLEGLPFNDWKQLEDDLVAGLAMIERDSHQAWL